MKKSITILLILLTFLTGCQTSTGGGDGVSATAAGRENAAPEAEWTVMMYICGADLESDSGYASENLATLAENAASNENVNFVIQTGGANAWHSEEILGIEISSRSVQRYLLTESGYQLVDDIGSRNMASSDTLVDFLTWTDENYPAKKKLLIMWDHGGGSVAGVLVDENYDRASMSSSELLHSLSQAGVKLDILAFDACLMANLEFAKAASVNVDYLFASEEVVPGQGMEYVTWPTLLMEDPTVDAQQLGLSMLKGTDAKYGEIGGMAEDILTFSLIDLSKIDEVYAAFDQLVIELGKLLPDPEAYTTASLFMLRGAEQFAPDSGMGQYDLGLLAIMAERAGVDKAVTDGVVEAVDAAVVDSIHGNFHPQSRGISVFYGLAINEYILDHYALNSFSDTYLAYLDAIRHDWSAPRSIYEETEKLPEISWDDYSVEMAVRLDDEGNPELVITNGDKAVIGVQYELYLFDEEDSTTYSLGRSGMIDVTADGNYTPRFTGTWPAIDGVFINTTIVEENLRYNLLNIPMTIFDDESGETFTGSLRAGYIFDNSLTGASEEDYTGHYEIFGIWTGQTSYDDVISRDVISLEGMEGAGVTFTLPEAFILTGKPTLQSKESGTVTLDETFAIEEIPLDPESGYLLRFVVTDAWDREQLSDAFILVYEEDGWIAIPFSMLGEYLDD